MHVLIYGIGLFSAAFVLHLAIWRFSIPRRHTLALLRLFLVAGATGLMLQLFLPPTSMLALNGPWQFLHVGLFYASMMLTYIIFYSLLENESPTLTIVRYIAEQGATGCRYEDVHRICEGENLLKPRIELLVHDRLITEREGCYVLTEKGRRMAKIFSGSMSITGLRSGE